MSFTRIPNKIIDEAKLNPYQFQLFSIIVRKTDGWCKVEDGISLSQFEKLVSFKKNKIINTLKELENLGYIEKKKNYDELTKTYSYSTFKISERVVSENNKGSASYKQGVVSENNKQKKAITKETNTNNIKINKKDLVIEILKEKDLFFINKQALNEWLEYKSFNYKKVGITKLLNMLSKYSFEVQQEMVDKSIMNNYAGLFEPKQQKHNTQHKSKRQAFDDLVDEVLGVPEQQQEARQQNYKQVEIIDGELF